jgi:hypothetical protein
MDIKKAFDEAVTSVAKACKDAAALDSVPEDNTVKL